MKERQQPRSELDVKYSQLDWTVKQYLNIQDLLTKPTIAPHRIDELKFHASLMAEQIAQDPKLRDELGTFLELKNQQKLIQFKGGE